MIADWAYDALGVKYSQVLAIAACAVSKRKRRLCVCVLRMLFVVDCYGSLLLASLIPLQCYDDFSAVGCMRGEGGRLGLGEFLTVHSLTIAH